MNGSLKNETPMQESAYRRPKIGSFLYFSIFIAIGVPFFMVRLLKTEGFLLILSNVCKSCFLWLNAVEIAYEDRIT